MACVRRHLRAALLAATALTFVSPCQTARAQSVSNLSGSAGIAIPSGTTLTNTETASTAYSGTLSGAGSFTDNGQTGATLTLSGANTYSGGTDVASGTLALGAANAAGTGGLTVFHGATFALNGFDQAVTDLEGAGTITSLGGGFTASSGLFSGSIASSGAFTKTGGGTLVLDGAASFAGGATIDSGTLRIGDSTSSGGSLSGAVTVTPGGTLSGHGALFGALANAGTVQPGGTIGTLTVNGAYTQTSSGILAIAVSPTASSVLAVNGAASLAGSLTILPEAGTYVPGTQYTILTATGGVTGTFSRLSSGPGSAMFSESYLPNAIDLVVMGDPTQQSTGLDPIGLSGLIAAIPSSADVTLSPFAAGLTALVAARSDPGQAAALAGSLGELRADIGTIDLANLTSFENFIVERMSRRMNLGMMTEVDNGLPGTFDVAMNGSDMPLFGPSGARAIVTADQPSAWIHGYGVLGSAGGETGYETFAYQTGGIVAGVDAKPTDTALIGGALAYEHTDFHLTGDEGESNTIDTYRVTLYGSQDLAPLHVPLVFDAALGYASNDYRDNDGLAVPGFAFNQTSRHDGNELTAEAGVSHGFDVAQGLVPGALSVVPRAGIEYDNIAQSAYTTGGASTPGLNLATSAADLDALRSTLGAKADLKLTRADGTVVTPEVRASWLHDYGDTNIPLTESFTGAPAAPFRIAGTHPGRDAALAGAGVNVGFSQAMSATIGYDAALREHELDHTIQAGFKYSW